MYKIIFFAYIPDCMEDRFGFNRDSYSFDMLYQSFDTKEDAVKFIKEVEAPRIFSMLMDEDDPDDFSFDLEEVSDEEIDLTFYFQDELDSIVEYKIKEI